MSNYRGRADKSRHSADRRANQTGRAVGQCDVHNKRAYLTRKEAKQDARRMSIEGAKRAKNLGVKNSRMTPYPCDAIEGMWHIGHMPASVRSGEWSRDAFREVAQRRSVEPELPRASEVGGAADREHDVRPDRMGEEAGE